jgi:DNA-binding MarR family transcriptional regulator
VVVGAERGDLLALLAPITKALRRIEDGAAARFGLSMWQYAILSVVSETAGMNQAEVADRLLYSRNRIIADLDLLERRSLLIRKPGADRRANQLEPTAAGIQVMRRIRGEIRHREDELLDVLPDYQRRALLAAARSLAAGLRDTAAPDGRGSGHVDSTVTSRP